MGPYQIIRPLGRGGMGAVYVSRDLRLGRVVALKLLSARLREQRGAKRRLIEEARATARLTHPNIVTLYDVGIDRDRVYLALEYVEGRTVAAALHGGALSVEEGLHIVAGIASAISAAHAQHITHRDLKPSNVLVGVDGRVRVLDFGIARVRTELDVDDREILEDLETVELPEALGTPRYMAPEQWNHQDDAPADIWALGMIMHFVLTGRHLVPSRPADAKSILAGGTELPLSRESRALPRDVRRMIRRCLSKRPDQRPTAEEIVQWLAGRPSASRAFESRRRRPFRGMAPLDVTDAPLLVGRAQDLDAAIERLRTEGLLVVTGPPGVGITSFVNAGLIARLRERQATEVISVRLGAQPLLALARALITASAGLPAVVDGVEEDLEFTTLDLVDDLSTETEPNVAELAEELRFMPSRGAALLHGLAKRYGTDVLVVVDGVTKLAESGVDRADARAFVEALVGAAGAREKVKTVLTIERSHLTQVPWGTALNRVLAATCVLEPLGPEDLRDMVNAQLGLAGYELEDPDAARRLADALHDDEAAPSLLQLTMRQCWEARDTERRQIPRSVTDACTNPTTVLDRHLDQLFARLPADSRTLAKKVILRLVDEDRCAKRLAKAKLLAEFGDGIDLLVERMIHDGILARDEGGWVSLAHVVFVRWRRLVGWLEESDVAFALVRELEARARAWLQADRSPELLLSGDSLRDAHRATAALPHRLSAEAIELVRRSAVARRRVQRRRSMLRAGFVLAASGLLLGAMLVGWVLEQRAQALDALRHRSETDRIRLLAAAARGRFERGDMRAARAMARAVLESADHSGTRALVDELLAQPHLDRQPTDGASYAVLLADGDKRAFVATQGGLVWRLDLGTGERSVVARHRDQVTALARLADGDLISVDWRGEVRRTQPGGRSSTVARLPGEGVTSSIAAIEHGAVILSRPNGRPIRLDVNTGSMEEIGASLTQSAVLLGVEGRELWVADAGGEVARLSSDGERELGRWNAGAEVSSIDFSPESNHLVIGSREGLVRVLDAQGIVRSWRMDSACRFVRWTDPGRVVAGCGSRLHQLDVESGARASLGLSLETLTAVAIGGDRIVLGTTEAVHVLARARVFRDARPPPPRFPGYAVAVSTHFDRVFLGGPHEVHVFELSTGRRRRRLSFSGDVRAMLVVGDMLYAAHGSVVSQIRLPDLRRRTILGAGAPIRALAEAPLGIVAGDAQGRIHRWSPRARHAEVIATLPEPDIRRLAAVGAGQLAIATRHRVYRWDGSRARPIARIGSQILGLAYDPTAALLFVTTLDGSLLQMDLHGRGRRVRERSRGRAYDLAAHAGRIALAGSSGRVRVLSPTGPPSELVGHSGEVNAVRFSPDGRWLLSAGDDATLRVWDGRTSRPAYGELVRADALADGESVTCGELSEARARSLGGCLRRDPAGVTFLHRPDRTPTRLGRVDAVAQRGDGLLAAIGGQLVAFEADGTRHREGRVGRGVTAIQVVEEDTWVGYDSGEVRRLGGGLTGLLDVESHRVNRLAEGPGGTLIVGFANGVVGIWDPRSATRIRSTRLHGPIQSLSVERSQVRVRSELGDELRWDASALGGGRCEALRRLGRESSAAWRSGVVVHEPPRFDASCRR